MKHLLFSLEPILDIVSEQTSVTFEDFKGPARDRIKSLLHSAKESASELVVFMAIPSFSFCTAGVAMVDYLPLGLAALSLLVAFLFFEVTAVREFNGPG